MSLRGTIEIDGEITRGMICIGLSSIRTKDSISVIENNGSIHFKGNVLLRSGIKISVTNSGVLTIGKNCVIGDITTIFCVRSITIGKGIRFANNVVVMDTDFHYLLNTETREIQQAEKEVILGNYSWIGSFVTIKKGACIPDYTIVIGPYSTVGKDYRNIIESYTMLAGNPAKPIRTGYVRIFNEKLEVEISKHYSATNSVFKLSEIGQCFYD